MFSLRSIATPAASGKESCGAELGTLNPSRVIWAESSAAARTVLVAVTDAAFDSRGLLGRDLRHRAPALDASSSPSLTFPVFLPGSVIPGPWEEGG